MSEPDPTVETLRERIAEHDRAVLAAVNARLALVAELKAYKEAHGIGFVDPERERRLVGALVEARQGPLSEEGVRELFAFVLELTKRELGR